MLPIAEKIIYAYVYDGKMANYCQKSKATKQNKRHNNNKTGGDGRGVKRQIIISS